MVFLEEEIPTRSSSSFICMFPSIYLILPYLPSMMMCFAVHVLLCGCLCCLALVSFFSFTLSLGRYLTCSSISPSLSLAFKSTQVEVCV